MFRPAARAVLARSFAAQAPRQARTLATKAKPAPKSSWKCAAVRWTAAAAAVYYYSTSSVFAEQQKCTRRLSAHHHYPQALTR